MTKYVGTGLGVTYAGGAITANLIRSIQVDETGEVVESSGSSDASATYLGTIKNGTAVLNLIDDSVNATILTKFEPGTSSTLTVTKTGSETFTGSALVTSRSLVVGYADLALVTVNLQWTGAITHA